MNAKCNRSGGALIFGEIYNLWVSEVSARLPGSSAVKTLALDTLCDLLFTSILLSMTDALGSISNNPNHQAQNPKSAKAAYPFDQKNQCQYGADACTDQIYACKLHWKTDRRMASANLMMHNTLQRPINHDVWMQWENVLNVLCLFFNICCGLSSISITSDQTQKNELQFCSC